MPKKKTETYSEAIDRLEKIVAQIDSNELDIDQLAARIKEANEIIAFCTAKLTKAEGEVEKLLADDAETKE
ncbi:MAG TPA: exodeoxyribonuclease VII small subunit [Candidatus Bacteroides intestinavium]|uniref:Exodeoxyribonuclease VII small subunit n=1 Tax=Candidatus Bacteroides intestinavium TaxID=2838469 RepID=A0A9D2HUJ0_9BACE|nr:exodeoxyribonuclease VII small subunit [Candidatus Bacteroides intestinavium]